MDLENSSITQDLKDNLHVYKKVGGKWKELGNEKGTTKLETRKEYALGDLEKKPIFELEDLLARQKKILENK